MFTGIIEAVGRLTARLGQGSDARLRIHAGTLALADVKLGDSIAVSGVCLTAAAFTSDGFWADVSAETLGRTVLGKLAIDARVNLEQALTPSSRLGGHLVSGHVDGIGSVTRFYEDGRSWRLHIRAPDRLARYIAEKGSICVDGVSLTVNGVQADEFEVNVVPHTLAHTTLGGYRAGRRVNLEVDVIARYLERLLAGRAGEPGAGISTALLRERGFL